jgi:hypothetical protein
LLCRTSQHPSSLVAAHLVLLARAAWHTLSQLLLLGADAPTAQQQLALLQQEQQEEDPTAGQKKRSKQLQDTELHEPSQGLHHMEGCALGRAWRVLCNPALTGFDALILLRKEALPFADRYACCLGLGGVHRSLACRNPACMDRLC